MKPRLPRPHHGKQVYLPCVFYFLLLFILARQAPKCQTYACAAFARLRDVAPTHGLQPCGGCLLPCAGWQEDGVRRRWLGGCECPQLLDLRSAGYPRGRATTVAGLIINHPLPDPSSMPPNRPPTHAIVTHTRAVNR